MKKKVVLILGVIILMLVTGFIFRGQIFSRFNKEVLEKCDPLQATSTGCALEVFSVPDPYSKQGVIDINMSGLLAEHVPGGILVRGTWDRPDQGVITLIPDADIFVRVKNSDGAPTPYYLAGINVYIFKTGATTKQSTQGQMLPTPVLIPNVDLMTFVPGISLDLAYIAKDSKHVYISGILDSSLDAPTLMAVEGTKYLFKDKNHVYDTRVEYKSPNSYHITPYDSATFEIFKEAYGYTKDKNGVYFEDNKIIGADPNTFQVVTNPSLSAGKGGEYPVYSYSKDVSKVYYLGEVVPNADPKTFTAIDNGGVYSHYYGKDNVAVYEGTTTIPLIDSKTAIILWYPIYEGCGPSHYIKDATHVFFKQTIVPGADPETFESLINGYGKDKRGIYNGLQFDSTLPKDFKPVCNYG